MKFKLTLFILIISIYNTAGDLHKAASNGDMKGLKTLLAAKPDLEALDGQGNTALVLAVVEKNTAMVKLLLEAGANPNTPGVMKLTPVHQAADHEPTLKLLLEAGGDEEKLDGMGANPLSYALMEGNMKTTGLLLNAKPELIKSQDRDGAGVLSSALAASASKRMKLISLLLEKGADVNQANNKGITPLMEAASQGDLQSMKLFMEKGADTTLRDKDGHSVFSHAASSSRFVADMFAMLDIKNLPAEEKPLLLEKAINGLGNGGLEFLLGLGFDVKDQPQLLFKAVDERSWSATRSLLRAGIPARIKNDGRDTPLSLAVRSGDPELARLLLQYGADPNDQGSLWQPLVLSACQNEKTDLAELLIAAGAKANLTFDDTPLRDWLVDYGFEDTAALWNQPLDGLKKKWDLDGPLTGEKLKQRKALFHGTWVDADKEITMELTPDGVMNREIDVFIVRKQKGSWTLGNGDLTISWEEKGKNQSVNHPVVSITEERLVLAYALEYKVFTRPGS